MVRSGLIGLALMACPLVLPAQGRPSFSNPPALAAPRGYSHVVDVPPGQRLLFIAGQVPLDSAGQLVGTGDARVQTRQVFENLKAALASAGASFSDVVKLTYFVRDVANLAVIREVRDGYVNVAAPPASTLIEVKGLFRPDVLLEVEAVAVVPVR